MGRVAAPVSWFALSAILLSVPSPLFSGSAFASGEVSTVALVAPGDAKRIEPISGRCPTFHWGAVAGATNLELAIYAVDEHPNDDAALEVVRHWILPGPATGYTPPLASCLDRGHAYAWTIRPHDVDGPGGWAEPMLFAIAAVPSEEEITAALEVLAARGLLAHENVTGARRMRVAAERAPSRDVSVATSGAALERETTSGGGVLRKAAAAITAGNPNASIRVSGEVRTIDPQDPTGPSRLWGNGRVEEIYGTLFDIPGTGEIEIPCYHGGVHYGLSKQIVDWGSAAAACPAGTWVCKADEIAACNTARPDHLFWDYFNCDGSSVSVAEDEHQGWLADEGSAPADLTMGTYRSESGAASNAPTCRSLPVWCCWD